jgi:hypothetical protein
VLLLAFVLGRWEWRALAVAVFYFGYLLADIHLVRQSRRTRFARNFAPVVMLAAAFPSLWRVVGPLEQAGSADVARAFNRMPRPLAWLLVDGWFLCYLLMLPYALWAMVTYCFDKYLQFQRFVRGFLVTLYLGLLQLMIFPSLRVEFPLAVDPSQRGLYVRFFGWTDPVREAKLLWLPGLIVSLSAFTLSFDFAHNRARFRVMWFFVVNAWISAVVLRGYPLSSVLLNFATVALVYLYMHVFKFHAHDGRRI